ncbi:MAG: hypothetical protein ACTHMC_00635 [Pseudobacter sp.]|uniref:hypothetical protein n=1 Tax=Pseudobacter sp. TaxID=2045420 RepID=UPI003F801E59
MINTVKNTYRLSAQKAFGVSVGATAVIYAILIYAGHPVYHSGDDLNIAWILGDGFGAGPSTCLPFLHNMHYWLSTPIAWLFSHFPGINWFSWSMIFTEYASATAICYLLLLRWPWQKAIAYFLLIMSFFGSFLLVYLHNSSASAMAITASLLLIWHTFTWPASRSTLTAAALFFFAGTLFRLHVAFPLLVVTGPFFLLIPGWKKKFQAAGWIAGMLIISFLFVFIQEKHYTNNCPNWQSEETYRQAKYSNINYYRDTNKPGLAAYKTELALLEDLILPDTVTVPVAALQAMAKESVSRRPITGIFTKDFAYWTFMNNRLALLTALLGLYIFYAARRQFLVMLTSLAAALVIVIYLILYMKLPEFMIPTLLLASTTLAAACGASEPGAIRKNKLIISGMILVLLAWGTVRTYKTGQVNRVAYEEFQKVHASLMRRPDLLFINMNDDEYFKYVSVFATPAEYPLHNFLFTDQPLSLRDAALLRDFGYSGFGDAVNNPRVRFSGQQLKSVQDYFERTTSKKLQWGEPDTTVNHLRIYKPMLVDSVIMDSK